MKKKTTFYTEPAYLLGTACLALGTSLMERADFGMSMVVAPAYLLHLKISQYLPFFSFGMAEYCFQALLLLILAAVLRRAKLNYLFSFGSAVLYGFILDGFLFLVRLIPASLFGVRLALFAAGMVICPLGVSLLFHTYITPEAYELFVKEIARRFRTNVTATKTVYDCCSCLLGVVLSFLFFGFGLPKGIKAGTLVCALLNGTIIGLWSRLLESRFEFADKFALKRFFE